MKHCIKARQHQPKEGSVEINCETCIFTAFHAQQRRRELRAVLAVVRVCAGGVVGDVAHLENAGHLLDQCGLHAFQHRHLAH
ncbi:MAG: hypothetical protein RL114_374 [Actinomycetota bacterium]